MRLLLAVASKRLLIILMFISTTSLAQNLFTVKVVGSGKPMILIHGIYCSGEVWKETVEYYQSKYQCHILTLAGFGGNIPPVLDSSNSFLEAVKDDIISYTKKQKLKNPVIVGHSMGGFIALWTAATAPDVFSKVISVDGLPFLSAISMAHLPKDSVKSLAMKIKKGMSQQTPEQIAANQKQYLPGMIQSKERIDQVIKIAVTADSRTQAQVLYELLTIDLRKTLGTIDCPVLLMGAWIAYKDFGATHDNILKQYTEQVSQIKNYKVELNDSSKHFIFYDDPKWFYEKTDHFLNLKANTSSKTKANAITLPKAKD